MIELNNEYKVTLNVHFLVSTIVVLFMALENFNHLQLTSYNTSTLFSFICFIGSVFFSDPIETAGLFIGLSMISFLCKTWRKGSRFAS